jgi:hypothetical protein
MVLPIGVARYAWMESRTNVPAFLGFCGKKAKE